MLEELACTCDGKPGEEQRGHRGDMTGRWEELVDLMNFRSHRCPSSITLIKENMGSPKQNLSVMRKSRISRVRRYGKVLVNRM